MNEFRAMDLVKVVDGDYIRGAILIIDEIDEVPGFATLIDLEGKRYFIPLRNIELVSRPEKLTN